MRFLKAFLAVLCLLVLAAHFLRYGNGLLMLGSLALLPLVFFPWRWARLTLGFALGLGSLEWLRTLLMLRGERLAAGLPHVRMALILGCVAGVTALAAWWIGQPPAPKTASEV